MTDMEYDSLQKRIAENHQESLKDLAGAFYRAIDNGLGKRDCLNLLLEAFDGPQHFPREDLPEMIQCVIERQFNRDVIIKVPEIDLGSGRVQVLLSAGGPKVESTPKPSERDWTEDSSHENGNYSNGCTECGESFIGHKRRRVCKVCMDAILSLNPTRTDRDWLESDLQGKPIVELECNTCHLLYSGAEGYVWCRACCDELERENDSYRD